VEIVDDIEVLAKIATFEETSDPAAWRLGWSWSDVGVYPAHITRLVVQGLVERTYSSNRYKLYKVSEKGWAALRGEAVQREPELIAEVPHDLFADIVGYDDIKELLVKAICLTKPIHVLLAGPPAIAKTLFLSELERAGGARAMWVVGSAASRAGLWDAVADRKPKWLLIDEIERMPLADMGGLLSLMETGRLVRTKVRRQMDIEVTVWVFAACNRLGAIPPELRSRFAVKHLKQYNSDEFVEVVTKVLVRREEVSGEDAAEIAKTLVGKTQDVRDAVRVARLSKLVGVEEAVRLLL